MAIIECEHCLTGFEYETKYTTVFEKHGLLRRVEKKTILTENPICPGCGRENHHSRRIKCPECNKFYMYSILNGTDKLICKTENCKNKNLLASTIRLACPHCSQISFVDQKIDNYTCSCGQIISVSSEVNRKSANTGEGIIISNGTPKNGDYIIWKDHRHDFPYSSRLIVHEDTEFALIDINGEKTCYKHDDPNFEKGFLLGDSVKTLGEKLKEAVEYDDSSTLSLGIYWVSRKRIPAKWREVIDLFLQDGRVEGRIRRQNNDKNESSIPPHAFATVTPEVSFDFEIIDAKAFYKKIKADAFTKDQLVCLANPNNTDAKTLQRLVMEEIRECLNKHFDPNLNLGFEMSAFTKAAKAEINTSLESWGLRIDSFQLDVELSWHSETTSGLDIPNAHGENNAHADPAESIESILKAVQALNETVQNNHQEQMDGIHAMETGIASQVTVLQDAIAGKLDGVISDIRNELGSIENEARNLGIINAEISDQLAAFQRVENAGLDELRDLDGKIDNLRKAFLNYKKESTEQEEASVDRIVQKLNDQHKAVIGRIDELEDALAQRVNAFWDKLDEILSSNTVSSEKVAEIIAAAQDSDVLSVEQAPVLRGLLVTTEVTEEQCRYMEFEDTAAFKSFVDDEQLNSLIGLTLGLSYVGNLHADSEPAIREYSFYSIMMAKLLERVLHKYYLENVFKPFNQKYFNDELNYCLRKKRDGDPRTPDLLEYVAGPKRKNNDKSFCWTEDYGNHSYKPTILTNISSLFLPEQTESWWKQFLFDLTDAKEHRNNIIHREITPNDARNFFQLLFKGENSLLRRLIMMRDVRVKEPEEFAPAE